MIFLFNLIEKKMHGDSERVWDRNLETWFQSPILLWKCKSLLPIIPVGTKEFDSFMYNFCGCFSVDGDDIDDVDDFDPVANGKHTLYANGPRQDDIGMYIVSHCCYWYNDFFFQFYGLSAF